MVEVAKITLIVLSVLLLAGGVIGFVKAKSKASLIAGTVSAALLGACYMYSQTAVKNGLITGDVVCILLLAMFVVRLRKGAKFMPSGLMMILNAVGATVVTIALIAG